MYNYNHQTSSANFNAQQRNLLPNFREFLSDALPASENLNVMEREGEVKSEMHVDWRRFEIISQSSSSSSCDDQFCNLPSNNSNNSHVSYMYQRIDELERKVLQQSHIISNLMKDNEYLKSRKIEKQTACRKKTHQLVNRGRPLTLVQETSFIESLDSGVGDLNQYLVKWNGTQYVIINIFKNRDEIMNYYCPLYQTKFPNKEFKLVLKCEDYKQLFKENQHIKTSEKKQAWRISLFTLDFYNFVKNHVRM